MFALSTGNCCNEVYHIINYRKVLVDLESETSTSDNSEVTVIVNLSSDSEDECTENSYKLFLLL